jgi:hypothetical protein
LLVYYKTPEFGFVMAVTTDYITAVHDVEVTVLFRMTFFINKYIMKIFKVQQNRIDLNELILISYSIVQNGFH